MRNIMDRKKLISGIEKLCGFETVKFTFEVPKPYIHGISVVAVNASKKVIYVKDGYYTISFDKLTNKELNVIYNSLYEFEYDFKETI